MREEIQARASKGPQCAWGRSVGDQHAANPPPCAATDESRMPAVFDGLDDIKRRDDSPLHPRVRVADARERDQLTVVVRADLHDAPP